MKAPKTKAILCDLVESGYTISTIAAQLHRHVLDAETATVPHIIDTFVEGKLKHLTRLLNEARDELDQAAVNCAEELTNDKETKEILAAAVGVKDRLNY